MAQLADAVDSKSTVREDMRVRIPLRAPHPWSPSRSLRTVPDPTALASPAVRRVRRLVLLGAALAAVVVVRDRIINEAEQRDADVLGLRAPRD